MFERSLGLTAAVLLSTAVVVACSTSTTGRGSAADADGGSQLDAPGSSPGSCDPRINSGAGCAEGADCVGGSCLVRSDTACRLDDADDGCDESSICVSGPKGLRCYAANPCPDNGICPSPQGQYATCNEESALPSKARICLPGRCKSNQDCARGFVCERTRISDILGTCGFGGSDSSNGAGTVWVEGCAFEPAQLVGTKPAGGSCTDPYDCAPTCCSCDGGKAVHVAACDLDTGKCRTPAETCREATYNVQVCKLP